MSYVGRGVGSIDSVFAPVTEMLPTRRFNIEACITQHVHASTPDSIFIPLHSLHMLTFNSRAVDCLWSPHDGLLSWSVGSRCVRWPPIFMQGPDSILGELIARGWGSKPGFLYILSLC